MRLIESIERILGGNNNDPLKGIFSEAALSWTQLPFCSKDMVGYGCGVFRGEIPLEIYNFFEVEDGNRKGELVITMFSSSGERNHKAWVWASLEDFRVVFSVKSLIEPEEENQREISGVKNLGKENISFDVLPGSLELRVYKFLLEKAKATIETAQSPSACVFCAAK